MSATPFPVTSAGAAAARLIGLADQCVMCGLCLPHCPTYRLEGTEAESPRGRIALAKALAGGAPLATAAAIEHLDHCLGCLSCQKVCPSQVRYEDILVGVRALPGLPRPARVPAPLRAALRDPARLTRAAKLAVRLRAGRWLPRLAPWLPRAWRRAARTLPDLPPPARLRPGPAPGAAPRGRIGLFRGCVASAYDRDTLSAARLLLERSGYEVVETADGLCCGALPRHRGDAAAAERHSAATRAAVGRAGVDTVLVAASGCHGDLAGATLGAWPGRTLDVHAFLAADAGFAALRFRALPRRAALHLPCTQVNAVGGVAAIRGLLGRIPDLAVLALPEQPRCCGAAGSYFLEFPEFADRLRAQKLEQAAALAPDLLLTTNVGCRVHLGNGLREEGRPLRVLHPLALLAEQLDNPAP